MSTRWQWLIRQLSRRLVLRAGIISLLSVASALLAIWLKPYIPDDLALKIGASAVDSILTILASSMLAVITFSLSTVVQAMSSVASTATPRAITLMQDDVAVQNMLSTFIGAFIFSLAGLILLKTGIYGDSGRVVLFAVTIIVVILLVITLLRWSDFLLSFGRLNEAIRRVETAASESIKMRREQPYLGGIGLTDVKTGIPEAAWNIEGDDIAYVLHIDMEALQAAAGEDRRIYLMVLPGSYIHPGCLLARVTGEPDKLTAEHIKEAITLGAERSFEQDPRLGITAMAEIASRALSPGINDPGTAVQIIGRAAKILALWEDERGDASVRYNKVHVPPLDLDDLFDDFFLPVGRDGKAISEVQLRLFRALEALNTIGKRMNDPRYIKATTRHARIAIERCEKELADSPMIDELREAAAPFLEK